MKIAITGKIGSGKSEVMTALKDLGAFTIKADEVNKRLLSDKVYLSMLKNHFPEAFIDGSFDKKTLTRIVFSDTNKRNLLNSLAHPEIYRIIKDECNGKKLAFVEVPVLSADRAKEFDVVWFVDCSDSARRERVAKRDNRTQNEIDDILLAQKDIDAKIYPNCEVIENDGTAKNLGEKVKILYNKVTKDN